MTCKVKTVFLFLLLTASSADVTVSPYTDALLPCSATLPPGAQEALLQVSWATNGSEIASFRNATQHIKNGLSWDTSLFLNGTFGLVVLNASFASQGLFECTVTYNSTQRDTANVTLSIQGKSLHSLKFSAFQ